MQRLAWMVVTLLGCGGTTVPATTPPPPTEVAVAPPPKPAPIPYCPQIEQEPVGTSYWAHELFPGCQDEPWPRMSLCAGKPCGRPCRVEFDVTRYGKPYDKRATVYNYASDTKLLIGSSNEDGSNPEVCVYDSDGKRKSCTFVGTLLGAAVRDAKGRLVAIDKGNFSDSLEYDAKGRIAKLGKIELAYDEQGRLVQHGGTKVEYDARGNAVSTDDGYRGRTFTYDERGFLVKQVETVPPKPEPDTKPVVETITITYENDRPKTMVYDGSSGSSGTISTLTYFYDGC